MSEDPRDQVMNDDKPDISEVLDSPKRQTFLLTLRFSQFKLAHRHLWSAIGGVLVGFGLGGIAFRWTWFWTWLTRADWTSLPAVIIGTSIPAIAGVMFAQSLAKRSMKALRKVDLEATHEYQRLEKQREAAEREARRVAWDHVFDACKAFARRRDDDPFILSVTKLTPNLNGGYSSVPVGAAAAAAWDGALWGVELRTHLPYLVKVLHTLVEIYRVEKMRVLLQAVDLLLPLAMDKQHWLPIDIDKVISAVAESQGEIPICVIGAQSETSIYHLGIIAERQRNVPLDADEVDCFIERKTNSYSPKDGFRSHTSKVDALPGFASLVDLIEQFVDPKC